MNTIEIEELKSKLTNESVVNAQLLKRINDLEWQIVRLKAGNEATSQVRCKAIVDSEKLERDNAALQKELMAQAVVNGKGGEREAKLLADNAALREALAISDDYINQMLHGDVELTHGQLESWRSEVNAARKEAQP